MWFLLIIVVLFVFLINCNRQISDYVYFLRFVRVCVGDTLLTYLSGYKEKEVDLSHHRGKIAIVTGGGRGLGEDIVKKLVQGDLHVIIGCRDTRRGEELFTQLRNAGVRTGKISAFNLDVSSLCSVQEFAKNIKKNFTKIHFLINNAAILGVPYTESVDGYESQLATNYLGHYYLTYLLSPELKSAGQFEDKARVVNVTSCAHYCGDINFNDINLKNEYLDVRAYTQSKLAQIVAGNYLDHFFKQHNVHVEVFAVHPGGVNTKIMVNSRLNSKFGKFILKKPENAAWSVIYAVASKTLHNRGGNYLANCKIKKAKSITYSRELQVKLFDFTNHLLKIDNYPYVLR